MRFRTTGRRGPHGLVKALSLTLMLTAVGASTTYAQRPANDTTPSRAESIVNLRDGEQKMRRAVSEGLQPRIEALKTTLKTAVEEVRTALARAQQEASDATADAYELAVSKAFTSVADGLDAILTERNVVLAASGGLTQAVTNAKTYFADQVASLKREAEARRAEAAKVQARLETLAQRNADQIAKGEIPHDLEVRARELAALAQGRETQAAVLEAGSQRIAQWLETLTGYQSVLGNLEGEYRVVFARAAGQQKVLADVATVRMEEWRLSQLVRQIGHLGQDLMSAQTGLEEVNADLTALISNPPSVDPNAAALPTPVVARGGLDILREVLAKKEVARAVPR